MTEADRVRKAIEDYAEGRITTQAFLDLLRRECEGAGAALLFVSHDRRLAEGFHRQVALAELNRVGGGA
jgi:predicted ABC-type transport system involved in lysophospholipase L1 biosynthesis ATPase subunit